jgi:ParB family chromosome partitioning protein
MEKWVIIAGERRWRAAVQAGLTTVTAVEATGPMTEDEILEEQLVENCLREDLRPIEQARAYKALITSRGLSQRQLAERLRIAQATVAKTIALLTLPEEIQVSVDAGEIGPTEAYQLSRVDNPTEQAAMAIEAKAGRLKRDDIEERTRSTRKGRGVTKGKAKKPTVRTFRTAGGPKVTIEFKRGLNSNLIVASLREVLRLAEDELGVDGQAA